MTKYDDSKKVINNYFDDKIRALIKGIKIDKKKLGNLQIEEDELREILTYVLANDYWQRMQYNQHHNEQLDHNIVNVVVTGIRHALPFDIFHELHREQNEALERIENIRFQEDQDITREFAAMILRSGATINSEYTGLLRNSLDKVDGTFLVDNLVFLGSALPRRALEHNVNLFLKTTLLNIQNTSNLSLREIITPYVTLNNHSDITNFEGYEGSDEQEDRKSTPSTDSCEFAQAQSADNLNLREVITPCLIRNDSLPDEGYEGSTEQENDQELIGLSLLFIHDENLGCT